MMTALDVPRFRLKFIVVGTKLPLLRPLVLLRNAFMEEGSMTACSYAGEDSSAMICILMLTTLEVATDGLM